MKNWGWGFLITGGALQTVEGLAHADATLNNLNYNETAIGSLVDPIESMLPVSLGWTLIIIGASILWFVPWIKKG